jgi:leucyl aminopeptidase
MIPKIVKRNKIIQANYTVALFNKIDDIKNLGLSTKEISYIRHQIKNKKHCITINKHPNYIILQHHKAEKNKDINLESLRKNGNDIINLIKNDFDTSKIFIVDSLFNKANFNAFIEGILLGNYSFLKYKTKKEATEIKEINIFSKDYKEEDIKRISIIAESVYLSRDLVNEPVSELNAPAFAKRIEVFSKEANLKCDIFNKTKIESLKMGGILAVNKGSIDPPFFACLEWKPKKAKNKKPIVLVGKGIVYDTGGLNIKPGSSMENMKADMGGAASVFAAIYAIAKLQMDVHVICLIPSTDNRPNGNAYVSGDVITMYDGSTVEVINTDAEGRMILADALAYAKKYDPAVVIDVATLTGAAHRTIGPHGVVAMHQKASSYMKTMKKSGEEVYERIAEFPFWSEYDETLKSDIADVKHMGGGYAGMITAGKFLARFTDYPFIHLDIAGPAFLDTNDSYRKKGATGIPTRLLIDFIEKSF